MRFTTLAWFYNAQDTLLHIRYLQYDSNTPNRFNNDLFGGLPIQSFKHELRRETQLKYRTFEYTDLYRKKVTEEIPYYHEEVLCCAQIEMDINYPLTELWGHLTRGEPLSKIVVRHYQIDHNGRMTPFIQYTFKDCWLIEHKTDAPMETLESYFIKFTYCCLDLHYYDGNRFAKHERCKAHEPDEKTVDNARYRERLAHEKAITDQQSQEASRLETPYVEDSRGAPIIHRFDIIATSEFNGKQISPGGLDDIAFHIVEKGQTVDALIDFLYDKPSEITRVHFKRVNKHLTDIVLPAQVVLITPEDTMRTSSQEFLAMAQLDEIEAYRQNLKIDPIDFAENFINYANAAGHAANGVSFGTTYFQTNTKQVQTVLQELQKAYSRDFRMAGGTLRIPELVAYRKQKFKELDSLLTKAMQSKLYGGMRHPNISKHVKINSKTIEHDWRIRQSRIIPSLSEFYGNTVTFSNALKTAGYLAIGLGAYETNEIIIKACTEGEEACKKAKYVEWSGFAGGVLGGWGAGYVAGAIVGIIITPIVAGGIVFVGLVAGASIAGGYNGGEFAKEKMKYFGTILYHRNKDPEKDIWVEPIGDLDPELWESL